ncbi:leucine-rich repeat domain-containing protein [Tellurirhabdus bombi]|uniref:leucine-rich repeat domain-containing protein n=1 Tax=Tellurirhabdus bombi TaxID=2907205 RepID=UPI001F178E00|nr:leucine-rich repeat domain-containing protein [Tellurirhabdus bombi]
MKTALTFILLLISGYSFAQSVCLTPDEHKTQRKQLEKNYLESQALFPEIKNRQLQLGGFYAMSFDERRLLAATEKFQKEAQKVFQQLAFIQNSSFACYVSLYIKPNGAIDQAAYEFIGTAPTANQAAQIQETFCNWLSTYQYTFTATSAFRVRTFISLKKEKLVKVALKPNTITTLEQAQLTTRPDTVKRLSLMKMGLTEVPEVVYRFTNVQELDLSGNELSRIPEGVFTLPKLKRLYLVGNRLKAETLQIPEDNHLTFLSLQYNQLSRVPESVANCRRLTSLWLGHNQFSAGLNMEPLLKLKRLRDLNLYNAGLSSLPEEIGRLKKLQILDLYHNKLQSLPDKICRLRRLQQLAVSENKLGELPKRLNRMRRLEKLYAHHNYLASLPTKLYRARRLQLISLSNNAFSYVPESLLRLKALRDLDMGNNRIQELPAGFTNLPRLEKLYLRGNPLTGEEQISVAMPVIHKLEGNKTEVFY